MSINVRVPIRKVLVEATVTKADGTVIPLGMVVAHDFGDNSLKRFVRRLRNAL